MPSSITGLRPALLPLFLACLAVPSAAVTFRVALPVADPGVLDGTTLSDPALRPVALALAEGLVGFDPATGFPKGGLAESWTVQDGVSYTFALKPARWSDGTPLKASDLAAAWTRTPRLPDLEALGTAVVRVTAPDPTHLSVTFARELPSTAVLGAPGLAVFPAPGEPGRSSGPFAVESREAGRSLTVAKNPFWREAATVKLDKIVFLFAGTAAEAERLYRTGQADWVPHGGGPGTAVEPGLKDAVTAPGWGTLFLRLNTGEPPLSDPVFRRALATNLDPAALAEELRGPVLVPFAGFVPKKPAAPTARTPGRLLMPVYRPGIPLTILHATGETNGRVARGVARQWSRALGLAVETKEAPFAQVKADRESGAYQVVLSGWLGDYPDPLAFLEPFRSGPDNDTRFEDFAFDSLVFLAQAAKPGQERDKALAEAEARLLDQNPVVPLLSFASVNQINLKRWAGWTANPTDIHPWPGIAPRK